jgi:hypothetical protein
MKLYLNDTAHEVALFTKLTPALYDKVTPLLSELANTKGAQAAAETEIMEKVFSRESLAKKIDLTKGQEAFKDIMGEFEFQEIVKTAYLKVRANLFELINVDETTIPKIFEFVKAVIDESKVQNTELLAGIQSEPSSEFWQNQDLDGILDSLKFFRETVCRRVRIM